MLRTTLVLLFLYAVTCQTIFSANLNGNQITPTAATTDGEGSGEFELDPDSLDLSYDIAFDYIESGITASHIHGPAREGANAAVLYTLTVTEGETEGSIKGSVKLTSAHVGHLKQGLLYVVIHSTDFPDGEIRGQILSTTKDYKAELKGEYEVPPVDTKASGDATFTIDFETSSIEYDLSHSVKDITAIHFHGPAEVGANAAVIVALDELAGDVSGTLTLTPTELGYFRAGLMYINVHSAAHPDGEIRGQIVADEDSDVVGWTIAGVLFAGFVALVVIAIIAVVIAALVLAYKKSDSIKQFIQKKRGAPTPTLSTDRVSGAPLLADHTYL